MGAGSRVVVAVVALAAAAAGTISAGTAQAVVGPTFGVEPSVNQLTVVGAPPGTSLELVDGSNAVVGTGATDANGALLWRDLTAGTYTVRTTEVPVTTSDPATVTDFSDPAPDQAFYDGQTLDEGFGYITTRDGTTLSANVSLPPGTAPFPTVVEYSGYDPSNPANTTMAQLYNSLGFAYVGVNIRGTGCSGGSFLNFEPIQSLDGYDAIETIAAQPWAKFHRVGMVGISYPGISQLYVARTQPPSLAAISPLSVIDDTYRGTLYPGGILNTGFAVPWAEERATQAAPYGQAWTKQRADAGDTVCADNQLLRLQNPDPLALIEDNPFYSPQMYDRVSPTTFVDDIDVPVFLAGAWQDEQTGGHFPAMLDQFSSSPHLYATMSNGAHIESLGLGVFRRYAEFLDLYVGQRVPNGATASLVAPILAQALTGVSGLSLPPGRNWSGMTYDEALATYEASKPVRILFEEGAADGEPSGAPLPRFTRSFDAWPVPRAEATSWYLRPGGALQRRPADVRPGQTTPRSYRADPDALPQTTYTGSGSGIWQAHPAYDWEQIPRGTGLGWITPPLKQTVVPIGSGSVDLWVSTKAGDTDLEVTLSEVRPNGREVYVQSGWLRASHRVLDPSSTALDPVPTHLEADAAPLPPGTPTLVRVELFPFAHPFRAGSRIRLTVDAPGNARPTWAFDTISHGERVAVSTDRQHRSRIVLPVVPGVRVPAQAPPCRSLRSQPCRTYPG